MYFKNKKSAIEHYDQCSVKALELAVRLTLYSENKDKDYGKNVDRLSLMTDYMVVDPSCFPYVDADPNNKKSVEKILEDNIFNALNTRDLDRFYSFKYHKTNSFTHMREKVKELTKYFSK